MRVADCDLGFEFAIHHLARGFFLDQVPHKLFHRGATDFKLAAQGVIGTGVSAVITNHDLGPLFAFGLVLRGAALDQDLGNDQPFEDLLFHERALAFRDRLVAFGHPGPVGGKGLFDVAALDLHPFGAGDYRIIEETFDGDVGGRGGCRGIGGAGIRGGKRQCQRKQQAWFHDHHSFTTLTLLMSGSLWIWARSSAEGAVSRFRIVSA